MHYWSATQIHVYNEYCKGDFSRISIDATGGIFRKIKRPDGENSGSIFLYDVTVNDLKTKYQYSVCNMVSERNDGDSIGYWLRQWIRDGASTPHEIVCDMFLALLSGVAKSFRQIFNITCYVNVCYNILFSGDTTLPNTYIRCVVAHTIKLFTSLKSLKREKLRTRQFYIRMLTKMLLSTSIHEIKDILFGIFIIAGSETEGEENGSITECDKKKQWLKSLIAEGSESTNETTFIDTEDDITDYEHHNKLPETDESLFKQWALRIYEESKVYVSNNGNRDNMQYLPEIIKEVLNLCKLLPLWTAVMAPLFKNSCSIASSAPVESNFNNIKNRLFRDKQLPLRIDDFILAHIQSIEGAVSLVNAKNLEFCGNKSLAKEKVELNEETTTMLFTDGDHKTYEEEISEEFETLQKEEESAIENWRGEGVTAHKRPRSYLENQKEWQFINLSENCQTIPIGILRNGNISSLKPISRNSKKY